MQGVEPTQDVGQTEHYKVGNRCRLDMLLGLKTRRLFAMHMQARMQMPEKIIEFWANFWHQPKETWEFSLILSIYFTNFSNISDIESRLFTSRIYCDISPTLS